MATIVSAKSGKIDGQNHTKQSPPSKNNGINKKVDETLRKSSHSC